MALGSCFSLHNIVLECVICEEKVQHAKHKRSRTLTRWKCQRPCAEEKGQCAKRKCSRALPTRWICQRPLQDQRSAPASQDPVCCNMLWFIMVCSRIVKDKQDKKGDSSCMFLNYLGISWNILEQFSLRFFQIFT